MNKYNIIYSDPPWSYQNKADSTTYHTTRIGFRKQPYPVMATDNIKALNVKEISADNCALFIWTTDWHLPDCLEVIKAWGFHYATVGFAWRKLNKQNKSLTILGQYTLKSGIELCLLATKGDVHKMIKSHKIKALVEAQRREHSRKPDEVRDRIVELFGDLPRIELFARQKIEGWDCWGNEVESNIKL